MWPDMVSQVLPAIKSPLLGGPVWGRRLRGLGLQIAVSAFVRTVLLR